MPQKTVIGVFEKPEDARRASEELERSGFPKERVDVASQSGEMGNVDYKTTETGSSSNKDESAIGRFFRNLFSDNNDEADRYSRVAERSGSVVTVHCSNNENADEVADILDRCGAVDVDERAAQYGYYGGTESANMRSNDMTGSTMRTSSDITPDTERTDMRGNDMSGSTIRTGNDITPEEGRSIPVVREEMQVNKGEVQTGGARLRSRIVEREVEENLRLREEHVFVNRTPVDRPANESDFTAFREGTVELTERAEVPIVNKESRVVEEVSLGKEVEEREETVRGTVRNTEVDVERLEGDRSRTPGSTGTPGRTNLSSDSNDFNTGRTDFSSDRRDLTDDPDMPGRGI